MKKILKKLLLLSVFFSLITSLSSLVWAKSSLPKKELFIVNTKWSAKEAPEKDRKLHMKRAERAVIRAMKRLDQEIANLCSEKKSVYRIQPKKSRLKLLTFKNFDTPVPGRFTHFDGYLVWRGEPYPPKGVLLIDTGSWNSDNLWRDSRVKRYLLKAHRARYATASLEMRYYGPGKKSSGDKNIVGSLKFRGNNYELIAKSNTWKEGNNWVVISREPLRLISNLPIRNWRSIIKRCVHKSLSKAVDIEWKLVYEPACN